MKIFIVLLFLLVSSVFASVGKITALKGEVSILRGTKTIIPKVGTELELKDTVATKDLSKVLILMNDNTSITIGKNSNMSIKEFVYDEKVIKNNKAKFKFGKGIYRTITGQIGKLNKPGFKIKTKSASIGIRGTVFDVVVTNQKTNVGVIYGGVYYVDEQTAKSFEVKEGEKLVYDDTSNSFSVIKGTLKESKTIDDDSKELKAQEKEDKKVEKQEKKKDKAQEKEDKKETQNNDQDEVQKDIQEDDIVLGNDKINNDIFDDGIDEQVLGEDIIETISEVDAIEEDIQTNSPPELTNKSVYELDEDSQLTFALEANDIDQDNLTYSLVSGTSNGELRFDESSGNIVYIPNENYFGTDSLKVAVSDGTHTIEKEIGIIVNNINDIPSLSVSNQVVDEDNTLKFNVSVQDLDGDTLTYVINANNGAASIDETTGEVTYVPNTHYSGSETLTLNVSDGIETLTKSIDIVVNEVVYEDELATPSNVLSSQLQAITDKVMNESSDSYMEFGYYDANGDGVYDSNDKTYITGDITPSQIIEEFIANQNTIDYTGGISALSNNEWSNGNINLNVDFGAQTFTGSMSVTNGNWSANINSGTITPSGLSSENITGSSDFGSITSGAMDGKFYGPSAESVSGTFELNTATQNTNGVYGAKSAK